MFDESVTNVQLENSCIITQPATRSCQKPDQHTWSRNVMERLNDGASSPKSFPFRTASQSQSSVEGHKREEKQGSEWEGQCRLWSDGLHNVKINHEDGVARNGVEWKYTVHVGLWRGVRQRKNELVSYMFTYLCQPDHLRLALQRMNKSISLERVHP